MRRIFFSRRGCDGFHQIHKAINIVRVREPEVANARIEERGLHANRFLNGPYPHGLDRDGEIFLLLGGKPTLDLVQIVQLWLTSKTITLCFPGANSQEISTHNELLR